MSNYAINLNTATMEATHELFKLDDTFVGTPNYMGLTYFWDMEYKHLLRDATISQRRKIHNKALELGIDFHEIGVKQWELIGKVLKVPVTKMIGKKYYQQLKNEVT